MGFCNDISPTCDTCYEATYGFCNDVVTFSLGLTGNATYYLSLIDKFDIVTEITITTDASGDFDVTQTWTEFFGAVEVVVYTDFERTIKVNYNIDGTSYDCTIMISGGATSSPTACPLILDFSIPCNSQYLAL